MRRVQIALLVLTTAAVSVPFGAWLAARDLDVVTRFALRSMTVMGYGSLDRVPALYGLRWNGQCR